MEPDTPAAGGWLLDDLAVEVVRGDITDQPDVEAVVNAANAQLTTGGGVAGAIHRAAGAGLAEECAPLAPIAPGECVATSAHGLPNRVVLHCLGPVHGRDHPADELLAACYRRALELADEHGLTSLATPAISTGAFGYPPDEAADVAARAVAATAGTLQRVHLLRFVCFDEAQVAHHRHAFDAVAG